MERLAARFLFVLANVFQAQQLLFRLFFPRSLNTRVERSLNFDLVVRHLRVYRETSDLTRSILLCCILLTFLGIMRHSLQTQHQRPSRGPFEASHPIEASHFSATASHRGGLQGGFWRALRGQSFLPLCLLYFCFTDFGLQ